MRFTSSHTDLIDEGQFGAPIILSVFNYAHANVYGVEFTGSYNRGNWSAYGNLSVGRERRPRLHRNSSISPRTISPTSPATTSIRTTANGSPPRVAFLTPGTAPDSVPI